MNTYLGHASAIVLSAILLSACGGGGSSSLIGPPNDDPRALAAATTANTNPMCSTSIIGSFYWEIGDSNSALASGSVGFAAPSAKTTMSIASASKWVYSSYVVQKVGVREADLPFLRFTSGYSNFGAPSCAPSDTVASCLDGHDGQDPATIGKFAYESGHMQHHAATVMGLGAADSSALADALRVTIGSFGFDYTQPLLAGGMTASASGYAGFLRRILKGELAIADALGSSKVCTNPMTCPSAVSAPIVDESWSYSLGHWVEDDPAVGDHSFSSAGVLGFYPWIDSTRTYYGILARQGSALDGAGGFRSAQCGRLIRQAWRTGAVVTSSTPSP